MVPWFVTLRDPPPHLLHHLLHTPPNWVLLLLSVISRFGALGLVASNSTYTRVVWFQIYQRDRKYKTHKHSIIFWIIIVTLALNTAIQSFHRTLRFMTMYYQTKLGCKRITSSEDTVEAIMSDSVSPHCDLYLDDTEQTIPNTLWPMMMDHHTFFLSFFWLQKFTCVPKISRSASD